MKNQKLSEMLTELEKSINKVEKVFIELQEKRVRMVLNGARQYAK